MHNKLNNTWEQTRIPWNLKNQNPRPKKWESWQISTYPKQSWEAVCFEGQEQSQGQNQQKPVDKYYTKPEQATTFCVSCDSFLIPYNLCPFFDQVTCLSLASNQAQKDENLKIKKLGNEQRSKGSCMIDIWQRQENIGWGYSYSIGWVIYEGRLRRGWGQLNTTQHNTTVGFQHKYKQNQGPLFDFLWAVPTADFFNPPLLSKSYILSTPFYYSLAIIVLLYFVL